MKPRHRKIICLAEDHQGNLEPNAGFSMLTAGTGTTEHNVI